MRRKDREITDINIINDIMERCDCCRIALHDNPFPYIVPMNFGISRDNDKFTLYFHCASQGKKLDLIRKNPNVSFEMDTKHILVGGENACDYTMDFESVCGNGIAEFVDDKQFALNLLMKKFTKKDSHSFSQKDLEAVTIFKISVTAITGKIHKTN